ncbi:MAG: hypothetical protein ACYTFT_05935 [Planctomycetota bacterium]|jgi:hypothetical protein
MSEAEQLVQTLADPAKTPQERTDALARLTGLKFSDATMGGQRAQYVVALRSAATNGDLDLRMRALQDLCGDKKDRDAQKRLIEGLEDPSKELVPPREALRFLNYDIHAGVFPIARRYAIKSPTDKAQHAALRILQQHPASADVLGQVFENATEDEESRYLAGSGLRTLAPEAFVVSAAKVMQNSLDTAELRTYALENAARLPTDPEDLVLRGAAEKVLEDPKSTDAMKGHARTVINKTPGPEEDGSKTPD